MTDGNARATVAARDLTAAAAAHLTEEVAMLLPFHDLVAFKKLLWKFFSAQPWGDKEAASLSSLVTPVLDEGWWEHRLADDLVLQHGIRAGSYIIDVTGPSSEEDSLFDRVFDGPVVPEATPHPMKVKFNIGGRASPGRWYRRGDDTQDRRAAALLDEPDVSDVMVAGDFVTVGLRRGSSWEKRLDAILAMVAELFYDPAAGPSVEPARTRDELVGEGLRTTAPQELHLLDPDTTEHRLRLQQALRDPSAEVRRVALATLAQSQDESFAAAVLTGAYEDDHRIVRRMAIDGAADLGAEAVRSLLEAGLGDDDSWIRWKAIRGLREVGIGPSSDAVALLSDDDDFQVRFEAAAAARDTG
ncbi:MAG: HEAT repeat domain-containing protein [Acidimicrobiia bacterium]